MSRIELYRPLQVANGCAAVAFGQEAARQLEVILRIVAAQLLQLARTRAGLRQVPFLAIDAGSL